MEVIEIQDIKTRVGVASTVRANDLIPVYVEGVKRFLRDNLSMGEEWVKTARGRLYNFSGKSGEGDILGSSADMGVAIATFFPEFPLITGQQLLRLYLKIGNKNPSGHVYIDFGVQINGKPRFNQIQAEILLKDFKSRGIDVGEGRVPDFNQLRLVADENCGLAYRLAEDVIAENIVAVSAYPFGTRVGKDGLFGAYLDGDGSWYAIVGGLPSSGSVGQMVRYDTKGVVPKKLDTSSDNLVDKLTRDFIKRF
ncbi:MAG: hypothetical protein WC533_04730 [Candidatus Pacearchaeota archaeon]